MKVIGLTGGIASGKSFVCSELAERFGLQVVDADKTAHAVMLKGTPAHAQVVAEFGQGILREDGEVDRTKVGEMIFADADKRKKLNSIMHPHIAWAIARQLFQHWLANQPIVILDAPLLYETGLHRATRAAVVVFCEREQQVERLMKRSGLQEDDARRRVAAQMPLEMKVARAQYVVDNSGQWEKTKERLEGLVESLKREHNSVLVDWLLAPRSLLAGSVMVVAVLLACLGMPLLATG